MGAIRDLTNNVTIQRLNPDGTYSEPVELKGVVGPVTVTAAKEPQVIKFTTAEDARPPLNLVASRRILDACTADPTGPTAFVVSTSEERIAPIREELRPYASHCGRTSATINGRKVVFAWSGKPRRYKGAFGTIGAMVDTTVTEAVREVLLERIPCGLGIQDFTERSDAYAITFSEVLPVCGMCNRKRLPDDTPCPYCEGRSEGRVDLERVRNERDAFYRTNRKKDDLIATLQSNEERTTALLRTQGETLRELTAERDEYKRAAEVEANAADRARASAKLNSDYASELEARFHRRDARLRAAAITTAKALALTASAAVGWRYGGPYVLQGWQRLAVAIPPEHTATIQQAGFFLLTGLVALLVLALNERRHRRAKKELAVTVNVMEHKAHGGELVHVDFAEPTLKIYNGWNRANAAADELICPVCGSRGYGWCPKHGKRVPVGSEETP